MSGLMRGGTAEPVSRDQFLRRELGQRKYRFSCSADHKQDWQPYQLLMLWITLPLHYNIHIIVLIDEFESRQDYLFYFILFGSGKRGNVSK